MPILQTAHGPVLHTEHSAYAVGVNSDGLIVQRYWGARLPYAEDYPPTAESNGFASFTGPGHLVPQEYPAWGVGLSYIEPCLKVTFADGVRALTLTAEPPQIEGEMLTYPLRDPVYPLRVRLCYRVHPTYDLIERWVEVENTGDVPMTLERVFSAAWHVPQQRRYHLSHMTGRWSEEWQIERAPLARGVTTLESRRLFTGHHQHSWFALDDGSAAEDAGEVWFGTLAWSGSWKTTAEVTEFGTTRLSTGLNDWDFAWQLAPGETFRTPSAFGGWTDGGFGAASRRFHDYVREHVLPHGAITHKILYNSWEATMFAVNEGGQRALAEIAAQMGIELFVMDDGWFKGRTSDRAGLGDWTPDAAKFPNGLQPLIEHVNALGMDFGLWVEPEMVNPDSDLYRQHPDWVIHFPNRPRSEARNQLILNLARTDVQDHLIDWLDRLLAEHNVTFIKWDANRNISEPGWPSAEREPRELWVRYIDGLYRVLTEVRARHPAVIFQSCSGGGGRADFGILHHADQVWVSDNTEATARIGIQEGFSQLFPASVMEAWVTDMGRDHGRGQLSRQLPPEMQKRLRDFVPLDFRFAVSMCGALGIGGNLLDWDEHERATAARWIALYKDIRAIVQLGDQYRLLPAQHHDYSAVQYMAKDGGEGVLFVFRAHMPEPASFPTLRLRGLDANARYHIEGQGTRSGLAWMRDGLSVPLMTEMHWESGEGVYATPGDFKAAVLRITRA